MSAAREQAREAAVQAKMLASGAEARRIATAVSDVWEPIVREILDTWEMANSHTALDAYVVMHGAIQRAKETLGG